MTRAAPLSVSGFAAALLLASASGTWASDDDLSATEQRGAIADCLHEMGKREWPLLQATYVERPWGGRTVIRILPHGGITPADAALINACADARLGRASPAPAPAMPRRNGCPPHAAVLYGGAAYCVGS